MIQKSFQILAVVVVACLLVSNAAIAGGGNRAGTSSGSQLLIPAGARYVAMGGAAAPISQGVESIWWNPAGLAHLPGQANAMFSYMPWIADIGVSYGAVGLDAGGLGKFGLSMKALNIGEIAITTADMPDGTGESFAPTYFTAGVSWAKQLTDQVSFGATAVLISESLPRASATGVAFDAGIQYNNMGGVEGLMLGVVVKNLGPSLQYDGPGLYRVASDANSAKATSNLKIEAAAFELPSQIEIGLAYQTQLGDMAALTASYIFQNNNFTYDDNKIGAEIAINEMAFIRGGYSLGLDVEEDYDYITGPTFGAGVHLKSGGLDFWIDYAFRMVEFFDNSNIFSVKIGF